MQMPSDMRVTEIPGQAWVKQAVVSGQRAAIIWTQFFDISPTKSCILRFL